MVYQTDTLISLISKGESTGCIEPGSDKTLKHNAETTHKLRAKDVLKHCVGSRPESSC